MMYKPYINHECVVDHACIHEWNGENDRCYKYISIFSNCMQVIEEYYNNIAIPQ